MEEALLNDILELEAWSNYIYGFAAFSGDPDLIEAFDWSEAATLTVGEYLHIIDVAETYLQGYNWTLLKNQVEPILRNPSTGLSNAEINEILGIFDDFASGDLSLLEDGFDFIRSYFAGVDPSTVLVTAIEEDLGGDGGGGPVGTGGSDELVGTPGPDDVDLGGGKDTFWAGPGDTGDDHIDGGKGGDVIGGGAGDDVLRGQGGFDTLFGGAGDDEIDGGAGRDTAWAGSGDDLVRGGGGNDVLGGGLGADDIDGGGGNDVIYGGPGDFSDAIEGGAGNDLIFGGAGNDILSGDGGDDVIYNGGGDDFVDGGAGEDELWGGPGDDILTGGADADVFAFAAGNGDDVVTDFANGEDMIKIEAGLSGFAELSVSASGADTVIGFGDVTVTLQNVDSTDIGAEDFVFV